MKFREELTGRCKITLGFGASLPAMWSHLTTHRKQREREQEVVTNFIGIPSPHPARCLLVIWTYSQQYRVACSFGLDLLHAPASLLPVVFQTSYIKTLFPKSDLPLASVRMRSMSSILQWIVNDLNATGFPKAKFSGFNYWIGSHRVTRKALDILNS